jgi:hypothetical protein
MHASLVADQGLCHQLRTRSTGHAHTVSMRAATGVCCGFEMCFMHASLVAHQGLCHQLRRLFLLLLLPKL